MASRQSPLVIPVRLALAVGLDGHPHLAVLGNRSAPGPGDEPLEKPPGLCLTSVLGGSRRVRDAAVLDTTKKRAREFRVPCHGGSSRIMKDASRPALSSGGLCSSLSGDSCKTPRAKGWSN
jgi:hypothetical protein